MASWPSTLPLPIADGYAIEIQDATVRTDMDVGPARVRRRTTSVPDRITLSCLFTAAQMSAFRAFWDGDWVGGAAWVSIPLRDGRSANSVVRECRPVPATYRAVPESVELWQVSLTVEVRHA